MIRTGYDTQEDSARFWCNTNWSARPRNVLGMDHQLVLGSNTITPSRPMSSYRLPCPIEHRQPGVRRRTRKYIPPLCRRNELRGEAAFFRSGCYYRAVQSLAGGRYDMLNIDSYDRLAQREQETRTIRRSPIRSAWFTSRPNRPACMPVTAPHFCPSPLDARPTVRSWTRKPASSMKSASSNPCLAKSQCHPVRVQDNQGKRQHA